jgi:hypothetical protein
VIAAKGPGADYRQTFPDPVHLLTVPRTS